MQDADDKNSVIRVPIEYGMLPVIMPTRTVNQVLTIPSH